MASARDIVLGFTQPQIFVHIGLLGLCRGYIGIMEKNMETTIFGLRFRVSSGLGSRPNSARNNCVLAGPRSGLGVRFGPGF